MERCSICGAMISENNTTGIGFGCMANIIKPALRDWKYHTHGLELWAKKCEVVIELFKESFANRKFRNEFKRDFTASIITQWDTNKRLSKKQIEICTNMLNQNHVFFDFKSVEKWWDKLQPFDSDPFYQEKISIYKKNYLKNRGKKQNED